MGVELDKKYAIIAIRACYRSASRHPVVVVLILFTIWFYRSFPLLFSFLVYASPVIVSTAVLLGTLLVFGHQNASKIRKEGKQQHHHQIHNLRVRAIEDTGIGGKGVRSEARENAIGKKIPIVSTVNLNDDHPRVKIDKRRNSIDNSVLMGYKKLKEEAKCEVCNHHNQKIDLGGEKIMFVNRCDQFQPQPPQANNTEDHKRWETGSEHAESSFPTASMVGAFPMVHDLPPLLQPEVPQNTHMLHVHRREPEVPHHVQMLHVHRSEPEVPHHAHTLHVHRSEPEVPHHAHMLHVHKSEPEVHHHAHTLHVHRSEPEVHHHAHTLHVHRSEPEVPHHHAHTLHVHRSEPEVPHHAHTLHVHRSEPEVPHHAHTLHVHRSEPEVPHHAQMSNVNAYAASNRSLESDDHDHDDDDHEDEEEEEAHVDEKEEETVATWTEDDQKNLKNLGKSEIERNQHMENLIARQKALRNMRLQAEENLVNINLDISYSATPIASTRRNSNASTRRNSIDLHIPYDFNETVLESDPPSVMMPRINPYDLPYDSSGDKSYPVGPTFQSDALSFQPNHQFSHHHESFDVGPATLLASRQNEGYYTFGASENVSQRSRSSDDDDMVKVHHVTRDGRVYEFKASNGGETRKEKNNFESDSLSFQPNNQFSHHHESSDVGPSTIGGYYTSEVREYVGNNDDNVKLHQVAEGHGRLDEVKPRDLGEKGYQGKSCSESSSSSSFSDVSDHLNDEEEEYDYRSAVMPSTPERQIQEQRKNIQQSPKLEHEDGRLSQRPP